MDTKKKWPFQPLEDSEVRCPGVRHFGGDRGFPGPCGIFIGCTGNAFMVGIGVFCSSKGPGLSTPTFLTPRKSGSESEDFPG